MKNIRKTSLNSVCSKLMITSLATCCIATASAVTSVSSAATAASAVPTAAKAKLVPPSTSFAIPANAPLTIQLLDSCWSNREDTTNQKIIGDYLMTAPSVPNSYEAAWKTARLVYFIGNYGVGEKRFVNSDEGVTLFDYGAKAGLIAQGLNANGLEGYYWYAIDLGSYGLAKGVLAAASGAKDGMAALQKAKAIDASYQWYGSSRILGRYYQELPGMFGGSSDKALALIKASTDSAPKFKNNWVFLGQYYISVSQYDKALEACKTALSLPALDGKYEEMRYTSEARRCVSKAQSKLD